MHTALNNTICEPCWGISRASNSTEIPELPVLRDRLSPSISDILGMPTFPQDMRTYKSHFQLHIHFWPLDKIMNCLIKLANVKSWRLSFWVSNLELRCKKIRWSKWRLLLFEPSYRPSQLCSLLKVEWWLLTLPIVFTIEPSETLATVFTIERRMVIADTPNCAHYWTWNGDWWHSQLCALLNGDWWLVTFAIVFTIDCRLFPIHRVFWLSILNYKPCHIQLKPWCPIERSERIRPTYRRRRAASPTSTSSKSLLRVLFKLPLQSRNMTPQADLEWAATQYKP